MSSEAIDVAVFIDWQNTYKTAREAFGWTSYPNEYGNYSPFQLARLLAAGNGRGAKGNLAMVDVHRGLPSQKYDAKGYAANRRQAAAWVKEDPIVHPKLRPLRYSRDPTVLPREKGVDVELALGATEWILTRKSAVVVVFTHDTDLVPLVEMICRLKGPACVETVSWTSSTFKQRIRTRAPIYHHGVSEAVFARVETRVNYAHA